MNANLQVQAARTSALAVPLDWRSTLLVKGRDRTTWLNGLVTCDLLKWADRDCKYGLFVGRNGRVLADALIAVGRDEVLVSVPSSTVDRLRQHLEHYVVMEDAEIASADDAFRAWSVHGPRSSDVVARSCAAGAVGGILDRTGLGGGLVLFPGPTRDDAEMMDRAVSAVQGLTGDRQGWDALRLERAVPEFGSDFDDTTYPQEAVLERTAVSFDKGCYLGQEVVCMLEMRGRVKRRLAPLVADGDEPLSAGACVVDESGIEAGLVTSAGWSPTLGHSVALAMLKRAQSEAGQAVVVAGARAKVVDRPVWR
ncbi:MAG: glycine cleavage T C-terminal barrel domain-containing protein [Polyangiaceae bacterium]|jgi:folate-binding protein YgfZ